MAPVGKKKKQSNQRLVRSKKGHVDAVPKVSSPEELLAQAEQLLSDCEFGKAEKVLHRVVQCSTADASMLEKASVFLLELGRTVWAKEGFLSAAKLSPQIGHLKYLYLSQLSEDNDALVYLDQAVFILEADFQTNPESGKALSSAYCSRCELFMTDLCDEANAEKQCEESLTSALIACPDNPEVLQMRASLRLVQQRREDALADITASLQLWLPKLKDASQSQSDDSDLDIQELTGLSCDQRMKTAEILIELSQLDVCLDVLDFLIEEDEDNPQVWYLYGLVYHKQGGDSVPAAQLHLTRARDMLLKQGDTPDSSPALQEILEILGQIGESTEDQDMPSEANDDIDSSSDEDL